MTSPYYAIRMSRSNATQFTCATQRRNARGYATIDDLYVIAPFAENEGEEMDKIRFTWHYRYGINL